MAKRNPDDRDRRRRLIEESQEARRQMQEILDRVEGRSVHADLHDGRRQHRGRARHLLDAAGDADEGIDVG